LQKGGGTQKSLFERFDFLTKFELFHYPPYLLLEKNHLLFRTLCSDRTLLRLSIRHNSKIADLGACVSNIRRLRASKKKLWPTASFLV